MGGFYYICAAEPERIRILDKCEPRSSTAWC